MSEQTTGLSLLDTAVSTALDAFARLESLPRHEAIRQYAQGQPTLRRIDAMLTIATEAGR